MLLKKINDLAGESSSFGIANIFRRNRIFNKIFWIIFSLLGGSASFYFSLDAVNSYLDFETITKIDYVYKHPLQFPTVTICPYYDTSYFQDKQLNQLVSDCQIMADNTCLKSLNNYFEKIDYNGYGLCIRFNSGKNWSNNSIPYLYSTIGGRDDYFKIEFKNIQHGLTLFIHDSDLPPRVEYTNIHETVVSLPPNSSTLIAIDKTDDNKLSLPYNDCLDDVSYFNLNKTIINYILKTLNHKYTQVNCLKLCFELDYIEKKPCQCTKTTLGNVWADCFVNYERLDTTGCTFKYKTSFVKNSVIDQCGKYCPLECDSTFYSHSLSSEIAPGDNSIRFKVYYTSLKVVTITEKPKTQLFDLISNIGGIFGLFIGIGFVSVFEVSEIFIEIFVHFTFKNSNPIHPMA